MVKTTPKFIMKVAVFHIFIFIKPTPKPGQVFCHYRHLNEIEYWNFFVGFTEFTNKII